MKRAWLAWLPWATLFLLAGLLWTRQIGRPLDLPSWHEFDYGSIARNFVREGNNILYPRIDWRGTGPGFTEMEFPIHPWLMAQLYRGFGWHIVYGRLIALGATLLSLLVFMRLARALLPETAAWAAVLFLAVNRITVYVASSVQPEALMLLFYLLAVYFFLRWYERGGSGNFVATGVAFAGAMLIKLPAAHLGLFFAGWALYRDGWRAFRRPALWALAVLPVLPAVWWYGHAHALWTTYGNSMGVSNEDHWLGLDLLRPRIFLNLFALEWIVVAGVGGLFVAALTLLPGRARSGEAATRVGWFWGAAVLLYCLVILRTAGAYWAWYYHIVAIPPMALLFGAGLERVRELGFRRRWPAVAGVGAGVLLGVAALLLAARQEHHSELLRDLLADRLPGVAWASLAALAAIVSLGLLFYRLPERGAPSRRFSGLWQAAAGAALAICFVVMGQFDLSLWRQFSDRTPQFVCAAGFTRLLPPRALIVSSGGVCHDPAGKRAANNASEEFYWLDRKGFNTCAGETSLEQLQAFSRAGARYFVADKAIVGEQPGLERDLRQSLPLVADCRASWLFALPFREGVGFTARIGLTAR